MIKKVKKIKVFIDEKYVMPLDVFQFTPPFEDGDFSYDYLTGGYYGQTDYPQLALFPSDAEGNIIDQYPVIQEEGVPKYQTLFKMLGYTLID